MQRQLDPYDPNLRTSLNNLARIHTAIGCTEKSAALTARAAQIPDWKTAPVPVLFATNRNVLSPPKGAITFGTEQKIALADVTACSSR